MWNKFKDWHAGLSTLGKVLLWAVTAAFVGTVIASASSAPTSKPQEPAPIVQSPQPKTPVITKKTVTEPQSIAFAKKTTNDPNLDKGKSELRTAGVDGIRTLTYELTYTDGKQTDKKLIKDEVTKQPVAEVTAIGTYVAPVQQANCDPNYSGACVPNVYPADVDCAGGSGNGPFYVSGPVYVVGTDRYGLDGNGDGVGCQ